MPPTRPVSGASIASVWGQQVHDFVFAPAGCTGVAGATVQMLAAAASRTLPLDTASDDPGGYLDASSNRLEVPTDGDGLYLCHVRVNTVDGAATDETRILLQVNGSPPDGSPISDTVGNEGGTTVGLSITAFLSLSVGDLVTVHAFQAGSGTRADVSVANLSLVRIGAEVGAP